MLNETSFTCVLLGKFPKLLHLSGCNIQYMQNYIFRRFKGFMCLCKIHKFSINSGFSLSKHYFYCLINENKNCMELKTLVQN